jgi:acetyl-CoA decarbonylase/synthase complex subunit gamma
MNTERSAQVHQAAGPQEVGEIDAAASGASEKAEKPCCCCAAISSRTDIIQVPPSTSEPWVMGTLDTPAGLVPQVDTQLRPNDHFGTWRVRWGIGRMRYRVDPGLYAVGRPTSESPVLVSANYKMSFDRLRSQLGGVDAWVLVLDTLGINVWCSAGKGTFGTDEIVGRVKANQLDEIVSHRTLVIPQLGAPGVAAHQVKNRCGFRVVYGPVRAADLPAFLANGMKATQEMREVTFPFLDRVALVPVELVRWAKYAVLLAIALLFLAGLGPEGYSWQRVASTGLFSGGLLLATYVASNVLGPALLPWLPGRALSFKGACLGIVLIAATAGLCWLGPGLAESWPVRLGWGLLIAAVASFVTMSFVGSTTYTSLSGVRWEMRIAVPLQLVAAVAGIVFWIVGRFV